MTDIRPHQADAADELWLQDREDGGWKAIEIIYTLYTRDPVSGRAIAAPGSAVYCPGEDHVAGLRTFLNDRRAGVPLEPAKCFRKRHCRDTWLHKVSPVDIYVGVRSYVVIELDQSTGWQFRKGHPGITMQADHGRDNFNLRHVMPKGPDAGADGPTADGCRILYFSAYPRGRFVHQQFHCHIDFGAAVTDPETIDPDIPNDGGRFPFVESSPCLGQPCGYPECD